MKGYLLTIGFCFWTLLSTGQNIVIQEVLYNGTLGNDKFELVNTTAGTINISTWWMCARFNYFQFSNVLEIEVLEGSLNMPPGSSVKMRLVNHNLNNTHSDFAIYTSSANFGNPALMHDFIQYGDDLNVGRGPEAVAKGIWRDLDPGAPLVLDFIPTAPAGQSTHFDGDNGGGGDTTYATDFTNGPSGLPVRLLTLTGMVNTLKQVELSWVALDEFNSQKHLVERSQNAQDYEVIGEVISKNLGATPGYYEFLDTDPIINSFNYYRIRQLDFDGVENISSTLYIKVKDIADHNIIISPMPIAGDACFSMELFWPQEEEKVQFRISDMTGKIVEEFFEPLREGYNVIMHQFYGILPGEYVMIITNNQGEYVIENFIIGKE